MPASSLLLVPQPFSLLEQLYGEFLLALINSWSGPCLKKVMCLQVFIITIHRFFIFGILNYSTPWWISGFPWKEKESTTSKLWKNLSHFRKNYCCSRMDLRRQSKKRSDCRSCVCCATRFGFSA